ncbi:MAG: 16S rRNA (guanine(527)-N(7))-methyltransferase RsmG [Sphingomicrobium sp.]
MIDELAAASGRDVSRETYEKIDEYAALLREEAQHQNLVSAATLETLWARHIIDSAQLARFMPKENACWLDIGSGAGLPGVVLAIILNTQITLIEPRRLRAEFLGRVVEELDIPATVVCGKAERFAGSFDVLTARAVAALDRLLALGQHLTHRDSLWVLPKGRNAKSELAEARRSWHYDLRAEPSITDPEAEILLLRNVRAKSTR